MCVWLWGNSGVVFQCGSKALTVPTFKGRYCEGLRALELTISEGSLQSTQRLGRYPTREGHDASGSTLQRQYMEITYLAITLNLADHDSGREGAMDFVCLLMNIVVS